MRLKDIFESKPVYDQFKKLSSALDMSDDQALIEALVSDVLDAGDNEYLYAWRIDKTGDPYDQTADPADEQTNYEFLEFARGMAHEKLGEVGARFDNMFRHGPIHIYREITVPQNWKYNPNQHPGLYWSWEKAAAYAHWGNDMGNSVMFTALVLEDQVDWRATLFQNAHPGYWEEKEIRVLKVPLNIVDVEMGGKSIL